MSHLYRNVPGLLPIPDVGGVFGDVLVISPLCRSVLAFCSLSRIVPGGSILRCDGSADIVGLRPLYICGDD